MKATKRKHDFILFLQVKVDWEVQASLFQTGYVEPIEEMGTQREFLVFFLALRFGEMPLKKQARDFYKHPL